MKPTTLCSIALLACFGLAAGCDKSAPNAATTSTAPGVAKKDIVGTWELDPASTADAAHNFVVAGLDKNAPAPTEAQIIERAKAIEPHIAADLGTLTFNADGTCIAESKRTQNSQHTTWTLEDGVVVIAVPNDEVGWRMRYESGALIKIPRTDKGREISWRRR